VKNIKTLGKDKKENAACPLFLVLALLLTALCSFLQIDQNHVVINRE
jgi:hypothetical protein